MLTTIIHHVYNIFINKDNILLFLSIWSFLELINWFAYLYMYFKIINPKTMKYESKDIDKIIKRIDKLSKKEAEYIIKGCVIYDKLTHSEIDYDKFDIKQMTRKEIIYLLGYSLFGLDLKQITTSPEFTKIYKLYLKIEYKLKHKFATDDSNRYLYRYWGKNFIKFNFRPLFIQFFIRIIVNLFHFYMRYILKFNYYVDPKSKIGFLYTGKDKGVSTDTSTCINKKDLIFIHGFGFGYIPYFKRLKYLNTQYNLIIMVLPNISSYNYYDDINTGLFPSAIHIQDSFYNFMNKHNINNINILAHSFGTYITQIIRNDPRNTIIDKIILIDPIVFWIGCFKMSVFIDQNITKSTGFVNRTIELLTRHLVYQCLYLKYICLRVMFGPDFWIYNSAELEDKNIMLVLEQDDYVIPADLLYKKINNNKISYYYLSNATHGSVLLDPKFDSVFKDIIKYYN
jgi:pimeloyl-ACP methyl ester carboxylesterase